jgi:hypothetical protein
MKKSNYVAVVTNKTMTEIQDFRIYSKSSPNKELILAYAKELQKRWPNKRVYVMTYGKAREQQIKFYNWRKEQDEKKLAICDRNLNKLMGRMVYNESTKRVAER